MLRAACSIQICFDKINIKIPGSIVLGGRNNYMSVPFKRALLASAVAFSSVASASVAPASDTPQARFAGQVFERQAQQRYIVKFKDASIMSGASISRAQILSQAGAVMKLDMVQSNAAAVEMTPRAAAAMANRGDVEYVGIDHKRHFMAQTVPYGISLVQADQVSDAPASAANGGKKICIIDSGMNLPHEDLGSQGGTVTGTNDSGTGNWFDHGGPHGTHVAGTIAALNNGLGVVGVIGSDPSVHIIKVFNEAGWGYSSSLTVAMQTCEANGADVINMSLGGSGSDSTENAAINSLYANGVLLIAAAGNDGVVGSGTDALSYPASYDNVVSVAAVDINSALADFSQKNAPVELSGPGVDTLSTFPNGLGSLESLTVGSTGYTINAMENQGNATGALFNFATGESTNSGANGKVCLIQRGNISFHDKVKNCQDSGGIGAVIYNNAAGSFGGTLGTTNTTTIPAVTASDTDGAAMLGQIGQSASISIGAGDYGKMSGTSMASPHVAGVAALVWSHHPSCSNQEVRDALAVTATDLGAAGRDVKFGHGLVQTKDAIDYLATQACGSGTPPPVDNAPTASFTNSCTELACSFNGSASTDDNGITGYSWNFGDGSTASGSTANHTYGADGTYTVTLTVTDTAAQTATSSSNVTVAATPPPPPPPTGNQLTNGVAVTGLSASKDGQLNFTLDVPAGATNLSFGMSGGTGDADLYVKFGSAPTLTSYDCRPFVGGNSESCPIASAQAGTYHVMIVAFSTFSGVSLTGSFTESTPPPPPPPPTGNELTNGVAMTGLSASKDGQLNFTLDVPAGATGLSFDMAGGSGDADLYVKFGSAPTTTSYDCRPFASGNSESCPIATAQAGTYHVMIVAFSTFANVSLTGSFTAASGGGGGGAGTFTNSNNVTISDNSTATSSIPVSRTGDSGTVTINVDIKHTYVGDLKLTLITPTGASAVLRDKTGGSSNDILESYTVNAAGVDSSGTWKLEVFDNAGGDTGIIDSWSVTFN